MLGAAGIDQPVVPTPAIAVDDAFRGDLPPDDPLQCALLAVRDDFGVDPALPLEDAGDRLPEGAAPPLSLPLEAAGPSGPEAAPVDLDTPDEPFLEGRLVEVDGPAEQAVPTVHRVAVEPRQQRRPARLDVDAEAPDCFFDPISA